MSIINSLNLYIRHYKEKAKFCFQNDQSNVLYYVIIPTSKTVGVGSIYISFVFEMMFIDFIEHEPTLMKYFKNKKIIPIVDMKNYKSQYVLKNVNTFNLFFDNCSNIDINNIYKYENYYISGWGGY